MTRKHEEGVVRPDINDKDLIIDNEGEDHDKDEINNESNKLMNCLAATANAEASSSSSEMMPIRFKAQEDKEEDEDQHEEAPLVIIKDPSAPTPKEKEIHDILHIPHRSWCPICIKARGKEDPHYKKNAGKAVQGKPVVSFDYKSFGQETDKDDKLTAIIIRDVTKTIYAHICTAKGASDEWLVNRIVDDIDELGHIEVIMKCDGEPALV